MKKLLFLISMFLFFFVANVIAQPNTTVIKNSNDDHDKITNLMVRSKDVILSDSIIKVLKLHAIKVNLHESLVMKCSFFLKMVYNENLTNAERIDACKYGLKLYDNADQALPLILFTTMIKKLESK